MPSNFYYFQVGVYKDVDEVAIAPIVIPEYVQITLHLDNSDCLSFRSAKLADWSTKVKDHLLQI